MATALLAAPTEATSPLILDVDLDSLQARLEAALGSYVREIRLVRHANGVILQGCAHSFYAKQLAQTVLMRLCDLPVIANEIEVR